jgi:hypothetical protein
MSNYNIKDYIAKRILMPFTLVGLLFMAKTIPAQEIAHGQNAFNSAKSIIEQYQKYSSFTEDGERISTEYTSLFLSLFKNPNLNLVFNDINPQLTPSNTIVVNQYVNDLRNNFPTGLDVVIDIESMEVVSHSAIKKTHNRYQLFVKANKEIYGLSKLKYIHNFKGQLFFELEYLLQDNGTIYMQIVNIYDLQSYTNHITNTRLKGFHIRLNVEPSGSRLLSQTFTDNNLWIQTPEISYNYGVNFSWYFNRHFGVSLGASKVQYMSRFGLKSFSGQSSTQMIDKDDDIYYPVVEITDLTELNTLDYLELPILLNFRTGGNKVVLYLDLGLAYGLSLNSSYSIEGVVKRMGNYPEYDVVFEDIPEYGFETVILDGNEKWSTNKRNLTGIGKLGLSIPLTYSSHLRIGGSVSYGLDDILYNKPKHSEDFISTTGTIPSKIQLFRVGIEVGLSVKVF